MTSARIRLSTLAFAALLTTGCGSTETAGYFGYNQVSVENNKHHAILGLDANRRAAFVVFDKDGAIVDFCSEPPPDAATALATKLSLEASGKGQAADAVTGEGKLAAAHESAQAVTELGKKTSETLFLREILFRRCEARLSTHVNASAEVVKTTDANKLTALADAQKKKNDADDAFFNAVIKSYEGIVRANVEVVGIDERNARLGLLAKLIAALPAERQKDAKLLDALAAASIDASKLADVYKRAAEMMAEDEKKKAEADKKKEEDDKKKKEAEDKKKEDDAKKKPAGATTTTKKTETTTTETK